jgi:hypothetical protein
MAHGPWVAKPPDWHDRGAPKYPIGAPGVVKGVRFPTPEWSIPTACDHSGWPELGQTPVTGPSDGFLATGKSLALSRFAPGE